MEEVWLKLKLRSSERNVCWQKRLLVKYPRYAEEYLEICPFWEAEENPPNYPTTFCKQRTFQAGNIGLQKKGRRFGQLRLCILLKIGSLESICHTIWSSWIQSRNASLCFFQNSQPISNHLPVMVKKRKETSTSKNSGRWPTKKRFVQEVGGWKDRANMHAMRTWTTFGFLSYTHKALF